MRIVDGLGQRFELRRRKLRKCFRNNDSGSRIDAGQHLNRTCGNRRSLNGRVYNLRVGDGRLVNHAASRKFKRTTRIAHRNLLGEEKVLDVRRERISVEHLGVDLYLADGRYVIQFHTIASRHPNDAEIITPCQLPARMNGRHHLVDNFIFLYVAHAENPITGRRLQQRYVVENQTPDTDCLRRHDFLLVHPHLMLGKTAYKKNTDLSRRDVENAGKNRIVRRFIKRNSTHRKLPKMKPITAPYNTPRTALQHTQPFCLKGKSQ
nr:MAG TPA: hypothetical protein [Caudoviricetes sp.]